MSIGAILLWIKSSWLGRAVAGAVILITVLGIVFIRGRQSGKDFIRRRQEKQMVEDVRRKEKDREDLRTQSHDDSLDEL